VLSRALSLLKLVIVAPIFLNTFVQDCEYFENRPMEPEYIIISKGNFNEIKSEPWVSVRDLSLFGH